MYHILVAITFFYDERWVIYDMVFPKFICSVMYLAVLACFFGLFLDMLLSDGLTESNAQESYRDQGTDLNVSLFA